MTNVALLLWPLAGFLTVAAVAAWWQARSAKREIDLGDALLSRNRLSPPSQEKYKAKQDEIGSFTRSRERRATVFATLAIAALLYLLLVD